MTEKHAERDYFFAHAQIASCLVADVVAFNSQWNLESFVGGLRAHFKALPVEADARPDTELIAAQIRAKAVVLFFPVPVRSSLVPLAETLARERLAVEQARSGEDAGAFRPLHIAWPHRWEHDKGCDVLLRLLSGLAAAGVDFRVSVFGGEAFEGTLALGKLREAVQEPSRLAHVGHLESHDEYLRALAATDVVLSTSNHEFFGVAMIEAALLGVRVLAPNALCYPEFFRPECLFRTEAHAARTLEAWCRSPDESVRAVRRARASTADTDLLPDVAGKIDTAAVCERLFRLCKGTT